MTSTATKLDSKAAGDITDGEPTFSADCNAPLPHPVAAASLAAVRPAPAA